MFDHDPIDAARAIDAALGARDRGSEADLRSGLDRPALSWAARARSLARSMRADDEPAIRAALIGLGQDDLARLRRELTQAQIDPVRLAPWLRGALLEVRRPTARARRPFPVDALRDWARALDGLPEAVWRHREVIDRLRGFFKSHDAAHLDQALDDVAAHAGPVDLTETGSRGDTLGAELAAYVDEHAADEPALMAKLGRLLPALIVAPTPRQRILARLLGLAAARADVEGLVGLRPILAAEVASLAAVARRTIAPSWPRPSW